MAICHCRTNGLTKINAQIRDPKSKFGSKRVDAIEAMGFGGLLHVGVKQIDIYTVQWLCTKFDCENRQLPLPDGHLLPITEADVRRVYKLPTGAHIKLENAHKNPKLQAKITAFGEDLGINPSDKYTANSLDLLEKLEGDKVKDPVKFAKLYVLYALGALLNPTGEEKVDFRYVPFLEPYNIARSYNWAGHVLECLFEALSKWQEKGLSRRKGDMHLLAVHYLDHIDGQGSLEPAPSCSRYTSMTSRNFRVVTEHIDGPPQIEIGSLRFRIQQEEAHNRECTRQLAYFTERVAESNQRLLQLKGQLAVTTKQKAREGPPKKTAKKRPCPASEDKPSKRQRRKNAPSKKRSTKDSKGEGMEKSKSTKNRKGEGKEERKSPNNSKEKGEAPATKKKTRHSSSPSLQEEARLTPISESHSVPGSREEGNASKEMVVYCSQSSAQPLSMRALDSTQTFQPSSLDSNVDIVCTQKSERPGWTNSRESSKNDEEQEKRDEQQDEEDNEDTDEGDEEENEETDNKQAEDKKGDGEEEEDEDGNLGEEKDDNEKEDGEGQDDNDQKEEGQDNKGDECPGDKDDKGAPKDKEEGHQKEQTTCFAGILKLAQQAALQAEACPGSYEEDDNDSYTALKLPIRGLQIHREFTPNKKFIRSPGFTDIKDLVGDITEVESAIVDEVWGGWGEPTDIVFQAGKTTLSKEEAQSLMDDQYIDTMVVDAYAAVLHSKQLIYPPKKLNKFIFPAYFTTAVLSDVEESSDPDQCKIDDIIEAQANLAKFSEGIELNILDCDYYFFPFCRDKHYVCFCVDIKKKKYVYMNSFDKESDKGFEGDKHIMRRTLKYFLTYMKPRRDSVMWDHFTWEVAGLVNQPDMFNCAIYMIWYIENWSDGHISESVQAKFRTPLACVFKRSKILADILLMPQNEHCKRMWAQARRANVERDATKRPPSIKKAAAEKAIARAETAAAKKAAAAAAKKAAAAAAKKAAAAEKAAAKKKADEEKKAKAPGGRQQPPRTRRPPQKKGN